MLVSHAILGQLSCFKITICIGTYSLKYILNKSLNTNDIELSNLFVCCNSEGVFLLLLNWEEYIYTLALSNCYWVPLCFFDNPTLACETSDFHSTFRSHARGHHSEWIQRSQSNWFTTYLIFSRFSANHSLHHWNVRRFIERLLMVTVLHWTLNMHNHCGESWIASFSLRSIKRMTWSWEQAQKVWTKGERKHEHDDESPWMELGLTDAARGWCGPSARGCRDI